MPLPFLKSSSASIASGTSTSAVPPPRPPSPLSAANATSRSSRSSRPSTAASTSSGIRDRRPSTRHGQSNLSQDPLDAPPVPAAPISQPSRSLSSRLLRRRPSEKTSLSRTPRLPSVSVASDTDGPSEPLTGSTTVSDVFAGQQDGGLGGPIAARGAEVGRRRSESEGGDLGMEEDPEAEKWRLRLNNENVWAGTGDRRGSDWSTATGSTTLNSPKLKGVFTALPPPPRQGNRAIIRPEAITAPLEEEIEVPHLGLQKDLWGRRSSDPAKVSALLESIMPTQLPLDHPFEQRPPASFQFQRKSSTSTTNSSSGHSRTAGLGSSVPKDISRFGDAPPLPVASTGTTHFSPPRNGRDGSPRSKRQADRGGSKRASPPPRSSSRLNNAVDTFDSSFSPQASSSFSSQKKLLASPSLLATAPRKSSLTSNAISPEHLWAYSQPLPSIKHKSRSSSFSTGSPLHAVPVPPVPSEMLYSPPPLRYRSPLRSGSGSRISVASPTRPPRLGRRAKGLASMSASEETGVESDEEDETQGSNPREIQPSTRAGGRGEVSAVCTDLGDGAYKWEIVIRPGRNQDNDEGRDTSTALSTIARTVPVPGSARNLNLCLSLDNPTGQLTFGQPPVISNATPRTNPTSRWQYTPASQTQPPIPHTRGNTFGATGTRRFGMGLTVEEVDGSPSPSPSTSTSISLGSTDIKSHPDRADTITPPPRMQTPPPMPSHPKINSTPKGFRSHRRTSSSGSRNWPEPAPSTPTSGRHSRDSSATYISSPSPRSTPRRTRLLSASQLNGGLYAPGTVDDLSEELEGIPLGAR